MAPRSGIPGPAVKPAALVRTLIAQSTAPGELVLDPFCGSGVAGVEARALERRFLLGDIDLAYLDPSLAELAPHGAIIARAAAVVEEPAEPPALGLLVRVAQSRSVVITLLLVVERREHAPDQLVVHLCGERRCAKKGAVIALGEGEQVQQAVLLVDPPDVERAEEEPCRPAEAAVDV